MQFFLPKDSPQKMGLQTIYPKFCTQKGSFPNPPLVWGKGSQEEPTLSASTSCINHRWRGMEDHMLQSIMQQFTTNQPNTSLDSHLPSLFLQEISPPPLCGYLLCSSIHNSNPCSVGTPPLQHVANQNVTLISSRFFFWLMLKTHHSLSLELESQLLELCNKILEFNVIDQCCDFIRYNSLKVEFDYCA